MAVASLNKFEPGEQMNEAEQHESECRDYRKQQLAAMRRWDWAAADAADRLASRALDLATIARANQFLAASRALA